MHHVTAQSRTWSTWVIVILAAFLILDITAQLAQPMASSDIWWHLVLGRQIFESGILVTDHSLFTWTPATAYHIYNSWLAEVLLFLTDKYTGAAGIIALRYIIYIGIVILAWRHASRLGIAGNPLTWIIIFLSMKLMMAVAIVKPELFSIGLMSLVVWLYYYLRWRGKDAWYLAYLYPLIFMLWANLHGAFFIASLFFASTVIGEFLNIRFNPDQALPKRPRKHYLIALGLCLPALFINPFGYELPLRILDIALHENVSEFSVIQAYNPTFNFNTPPLYLLDYLIAAMVLFIILLWQKLRLRQVDWVVILSFIAYSLLFVQIGRVTYFLGPIFLFASLDLLAVKQNSWAWPKALRGKIAITSVCILAATFIGYRSLSFYGCNLPFSINQLAFVLDPTSGTVSDSASFIEQNISGNKIGNAYEDGGYLLYRMWPDKKVMIDPRYFPFKEWISEYFEFIRAKNIGKFVKKYSADTWLIKYNDVAIFEWFSLSDNWSLAYLGRNSAVFVPAINASISHQISDRIDNLNTVTSIITPLITALQIEDLILARRLQKAARLNLDKSCENNQLFIEELDRSVKGFSLYYDEQYIEAINYLGKPGKHIHTHGKMADAVMKVAEKLTDKGEFAQARRSYLVIFDAIPRDFITDTQAVVDMFNIMLLDWNYRRTINPIDVGIEKTDNDVHWENFAEFFISNEENLQPTLGFMVNVARAMKLGNYEGPPILISRNYGRYSDE